MTALTCGELKLNSSIKIEKITNLKIDIVKNDHGLMEIEGVISGSENKKNILEDILRSNIGTKISLHRKDRDIPIFGGLVESVELIIRDNIYYVKIKSISATILMDRDRKKRSFQNVGKTYEEIVYEIISEYIDGAVICTVGTEKEIGKPLIQYNETDWEFIKRLASHFDSVITPEITQIMPRVWFGFPNTIREVEIDREEYIYGQSEDYYKIGGMYSSYEPGDFRYIETRTYEVFELGDFTILNGQGYVLYEIRGQMEKGELLFTYRFGSEGHKYGKKYYNERIRGMSLLGEVSRTENETLGIKLDIDEGNGGEYLYD